MDPLQQAINEETPPVAAELVRAAAREAKAKLKEMAPKKRTQPEPRNLQDIVEEDCISLLQSQQSAGTLFKQEAVKKMGNYNDLEPKEKAMVTLGLNSILYLSDNSQQRLFHMQDWKELKAKFPKCFYERRSLGGIENDLSKIKEMAMYDIQGARNLSQRCEMDSTRKMHADTFAIYSHCLELLEFHQYVFEEHVDVTEGNLTIKIWGPIMEKLFRQTSLRCKWGGSVGDSSGDTDGTGLKVDLRVVNNTKKRGKLGKYQANPAVTRFDAGVAKTTGDRVKVLVEAKCVLDRLVQEKRTRCDRIEVPSLQIVGTKVYLFSLLLVADGVYVGNREGSGSLPVAVSQLSSLKRVIKLLLKFKEATLKIADIGLYPELGSGSSSSSPNNKMAWQRDTWMPPRSDRKKDVPSVPNIFVASDKY